MKEKQEEMTGTEAAGYILGVGLGLIWRFYKVFAVLFACMGLFLVLVGGGFTVIVRQATNDFAWTLRFGDGALLGVPLLLGSVVLWFLHPKAQR